MGSFFQSVVLLCLLGQLRAFFHGTGSMAYRRKIHPGQKSLQPSLHAPFTATFRRKYNQNMFLNPWNIVKNVLSTSGEFIKQLVESQETDNEPSLDTDGSGSSIPVVHPDGSKCAGEVSQSESNGHGTLVYPRWPEVLVRPNECVEPHEDEPLNEAGCVHEDDCGGKYVGQMAAGKMHGHGTFTDKEGRVVQGVWKEGKIHNGSGTIFFAETENVRTGTWVNGKMKGNGSSVSPDGYAYRGEYRQGRRHGHGTMTYADGNVYEGEWMRGKQHGQGTQTDKEGRVLQGEWREGRMYNCKGTVLFPNSKDVFTGTWVNGELEGNGSVVSHGHSYMGEFSQGQTHGQGIITYPDGNVYKGEFARGKRHGYGTQTDKEGRVLQGEWKEGKIHNGNGTLCIPTTKFVCTGIWVNGKMEGNGSSVSPDGYRYVGEFRQNLRHGQGTTTYPEGTVYEGEWARDKQHGQGIQKDPEGRVLVGEWRKGRIYSGSGTLRISNTKNVYTGTWVNGMLEGSGSAACNGYLYVGEFSQGNYRGRGKLVYPDGAVYEGGFVRGKPHGQGTQTDKEGRVLQGEWREGKIHNGSGALFFVSLQNVKTGTWVNGLLEGHGTDESLTGHTYVGEYRQGQKHGQGTMNYPDGNVYEGEWAINKQHGKGVLTDKEGRVLQGEWRESKFRNGTGSLLIPTTKDVVTGTWVNGMMEGNGSVVAQGHSYVGEFSQGQKHGQGTVTYPDGTVYEGEWASNKPNGRGKQTKASGKVWTGEWKDGKKVDPSRRREKDAK